ncbi:glycosyltransferase family 2 protein [Rhodoplanes roseus]|uniref:Glycosyltransferase 2-like domain-containing protein n=1 Tax=Rhodoplanes roseus TaxID=29409 RepID=A0A327L060_9BRAD|nr:glycosyltransferase family 2 protein [Rhodoplanes roseus]RAI43866.1 hypothetical protein CH341_12110 [Rhodoplanes roseus]
MRLSVIIPVYNERATLGRVVAAVTRALPGVEKEILIVDDGSRDGTTEWLKVNFPNGECSATTVSLDDRGQLSFCRQADGASTTFRPIYRTENGGKGAALRDGFARVTGDVAVIQDADLEYQPEDWTAMFDLIARRKVADVVYGSRFCGGRSGSPYLRHYLGNRLISFLFNTLYDQALSDIEVCYKMMTVSVLRSLVLSSNDFGIEIEISAGIARRAGLRIHETGISYAGRSYAEGKKIGWHDGVKALWYLLKFRFSRAVAAPEARCPSMHR